jgi:LytS/YehU family sensor histidine kinase
MTFLYCISFFYFNKDRATVLLEKDRQGKARPEIARRHAINQLIIFNLVLFAAFTGFCAVIQKNFFQEHLPPIGGYGLRFLVCFLLVAVELRVILLLEKSRAHEIAYEQLRSAHLQSELALLKGQLNPHFLFNSLSSLSAVVREDPRRAQQYINHLSKVFRYTLEVANTDFVSLKEELQYLRSYAELLIMRYEAGFRLRMPTEDAITDMRIPPMSLQLLLENALKHNRASVTDPLKVDITIHPQYIQVRNNLQPLSIPEPGAGIGLSNLNQRYRILLDKDIDITRTNTEFIVQLPLP